MFLVECLFVQKISFCRGPFYEDHLTMAASDILIDLYWVESEIIKTITTVHKFSISLHFLSKNFALSWFIKLPVRYSIRGKYVEFVLHKLKVQTLRKISMFRFKNFYILCTIIVCSEITFSKNWYHIESSQLNCNAYPLAGSYMTRVFTETYFWTDYNT